MSPYDADTLTRGGPYHWVLPNPRVLLLDEATSALDTASEAVVQVSSPPQLSDRPLAPTLTFDKPLKTKPLLRKLCSCLTVTHTNPRNHKL